MHTLYFNSVYRFLFDFKRYRFSGVKIVDFLNVHFSMNPLHLPENQLYSMLLFCLLFSSYCDLSNCETMSAVQCQKYQVFFKVQLHIYEMGPINDNEWLFP